MTKSYKNEEGSTVHPTWFSAAAILTLPNLQLSAISVVQQKQVSREEHVGSSHQYSDENDFSGHACMYILTKHVKLRKGFWKVRIFQK